MKKQLSCQGFKIDTSLLMKNTKSFKIFQKSPKFPYEQNQLHSVRDLSQNFYLSKWIFEKSTWIPQILESLGNFEGFWVRVN